MPQGFSPAGRVVVVTGAGSGIGRALVRVAAERGARAVVACDLDEAAAQETLDGLGRPAEAPDHAMALDVADEGQLVAAVAEIEASVGPIDLWCSNAGVHRGFGIGSELDWDVSLGVHVRAHANAARVLAPRMAGRGEGWFMVTASAAGLLTDVACAPYAATKHAAVAFAEWLSITYDAAGITVSCICPQGVKTNMNADRRDGATGSGVDYLEADDVARDAFEALGEGRFLVLPHPEVATYELRRAQDRERWLAGMRRLSASRTSATA